MTRQRLEYATSVYRQIFLDHYGQGPYPCVFCGLDVTWPEVDVHHHDHDRSNNEPENLTPCHSACHNRHHKTGSKHSDETKNKMRVAAARRPHGTRLGTVQSAKARIAISTALSGKKHTDQHHARIVISRKAKRSVWHSEETRKKISEGNQRAASVQLTCECGAGPFRGVIGLKAHQRQRHSCQ